MHKRLLILLSALFLSLLGGWWYVHFTKIQISINKVAETSTSTLVTSVSTTSTSVGASHGGCLAEGEKVRIEINDKKRRLSDVEASVTISIQNNTGTTSGFDISNVLGTYHPIEIHQCGVYVLELVNYDYTKSKQERGYRNELWKYSYSGEKQKIETLYELSTTTHHDYGTDFRIDPTEKHLALRKGYLGSPDFAIIIKDIHTLKDVFTLPMTDIEKQNPDLVGDIGFIESSDNAWSPDGRYFWADLADGANELGFIRIDSTDWSYKLLPAPPDVFGGDALNLDTGDITVHPGNVWFGDKEAYDQDRTERRAKGIGTDLYIENLFTHKRILIATSAQPNAYFMPKWISSSTLEYFMPTVSGDKGEEKKWNIDASR